MAASVVGFYTTFDTAVSLEYARAKNEDMTNRCQLLAKLAQPGVKGLTESSVRTLVGPDVIVDIEDGNLWVDDLVFRLEEGRIKEIDMAKSCPPLQLAPP